MLRWLDHFHSCSVHYCPDMAGTRERASFACILRVLLPFSFSAVSVFFYPCSFSCFFFFLSLLLLFILSSYLSFTLCGCCSYISQSFSIQITFYFFFLNFPFVTTFFTVCCAVSLHFGSYFLLKCFQCLFLSFVLLQ